LFKTVIRADTTSAVKICQSSVLTNQAYTNYSNTPICAEWPH